MSTLRTGFASTLLLIHVAGGLAGCARHDATVAVQSQPTEPTRTEPSPSRSGAAGPAAKQASLVVQGEAVIVSRVPQPGTVPYRDCLTFIKYKVLSVERGEYPKPEILTVQWGMKENKLTAAARRKVGDRQRLELEPFDRYPELERVMQANDTDEYELTPYWAP
jgi:hypothetical protein